ncbi:MAG: permease, partial [Candidatus Bipolaricaulia bacterium]
MHILLDIWDYGWGALVEYLSAHVLTCLIPAFFIAGAIGVFVAQGAILRYFGAKTKKWLSYSVASVSGAILAVCSCTILPLFAGIYKRGAGLGPAIAFLFSGPAINILAIVYSARLLGYDIGLARAIGAILFSIVIGLLMATIYWREDRAR